MAGSGVMSFNSANAARGSADTQQKSRAESGKTSQKLQEKINQAEQKVAQDSQQAAKKGYTISISKAEPALAKPAMPGMSQPLREYLRVQNS